MVRRTMIFVRSKYHSSILFAKRLVLTFWVSVQGLYFRRRFRRMEVYVSPVMRLSKCRERLASGASCAYLSEGA